MTQNSNKHNAAQTAHRVGGLSAREELEQLVQFSRGDQIAKLVKRGILDPDDLQIAKSKAAMQARDALVVNLKGLREARRKTKGMGSAVNINGLRRSDVSPDGRMLSAREELNEILFAFDPRPRNDYGQFSPEDGGPNPMAMKIVYRMAPPRQQQAPPEETEEERKLREQGLTSSS
jgi:hypothetical protein